MMNFIATATEGGGEFASFGSGDSGGRLQARATGRARTGNASAGEVRAVRSRINRELAGLNPRSGGARKRRALLQEIADNASGRGNVRRGVLADIASELADL